MPLYLHADRGRERAEEVRPVERVFVGNPEVSEVVFTAC
jgi:hypothetical protein